MGGSSLPQVAFVPVQFGVLRRAESQALSLSIVFAPAVVWGRHHRFASDVTSPRPSRLSTGKSMRPPNRKPGCRFYYSHAGFKLGLMSLQLPQIARP
jgi:hypothetical protein